MSSSNLRLRSPTKHTSIEASSPITASPVKSHRAAALKTVAALGVVAVAAVSGVAYFSTRHNTSPNQHASPARTHGQTFQGLDACSAPWGQCGGTNWNGPICCSGGAFCSAQSEWYSQCLPAGSTPFPAFTPQPTQATPSPTTPGCVADWGQCGGRTYTGATCCASPGSFCSKQSDWYSQCLPAGTAPFPLVEYSFNQIVNGIALNPQEDYNGVITGGATETAGYEGKALDFNGVDGKVRVSNSELWDFSVSGFTLSANVKRDQAVDEDGIITKWYYTDSFLLKFDGNSLVFAINYATLGSQVISYDFQDEAYLGQWNSVKASYQRSGATQSIMKLWWNGNLVASATFNDNVIVPSVVPVLVANTNNEWSFFKGAIDNVKIWDAAV